MPVSGHRTMGILRDLVKTAADAIIHKYQQSMTVSSSLLYNLTAGLLQSCFSYLTLLDYGSL